jgi:chloramphenicol 3-O-phosphotransferase
MGVLVVLNTVPSACQSGVNDAIGNTCDKSTDSIRDIIMDQLRNESEEAGKEDKNGCGKKGMNFLQLLANAFANMQAEHLDKAMQAQKDMQGADKDDTKAFMEANQEFQVQMQMFKMVSESASNALKSIGESLTSIARKQ